MEQHSYMTLLLVLIIVQMTGVFYPIINSPQNSYTTSNTCSEIAQTIQQELQANLQQQESNRQQSALTPAVYENNQALHDTLRGIVREELISFFSAIEDSNTSSTSTSQPTVEHSIYDNKAGLTEIDEATIEIALTESRLIIDTAKANGAWTTENTMDISAHAFKLPINQRRKLHGDIMSAITRKEIRLEGVSPNF